MTLPATAPVPTGRQAVATVAALWAAAIGSSAILFLWLADPIRNFEASVASAVVGAFSDRQVAVAGDAVVAVSSGDGPVFFGVVTRSCSMTAVLLAVGMAGAMAPRGRLRRRAAPVLAGLAVAAGFNLFRITLALWAGSTWGTDVMGRVHDTAGTPLTLAGAALSIYVMWRVAERSGRSPEPRAGTENSSTSTSSPK